MAKPVARYLIEASRPGKDVPICIGDTRAALDAVLGEPAHRRREAGARSEKLLHGPRLRSSTTHSLDFWATSTVRRPDR
jgi:hypothetical protein